MVELRWLLRAPLLPIGIMIRQLYRQRAPGGGVSFHHIDLSLTHVDMAGPHAAEVATDGRRFT